MLEKIGEVLIDIWDGIGDFFYNYGDIVMGVVVMLIIGGLLVGLLAGGVANERNEIVAGTIVDKEMNTGSTHYSSDKNGSHMNSYPTTYRFTIRGEKDGETVDYTFEVTEDEYAAYKIGDWYER